MTISQIGVLASVFTAMCVVGRIAYLYSFLTPVLGRVIAHDYDPKERDMERLAMFVTPGQTTWGDPTDMIPVRTVCTRVGYSYAGEDYRSDVNVTVVKGWAPGAMIKLWIDAREPKNVTANGAKYWLCWLFLTSVFAVGFHHLPS